MSSQPKPRYTKEGEDLNPEERIRSLLLEGRISEALSLFNQAGDLLPPGSKLREVLAPPRITRKDYRDVDRSAEFHWLKTQATAHQGKWVALVGETLVASSDTLKELLAQIEQRHFERKPLIHHLI